jgi:hypothetical protein
MANPPHDDVKDCTPVADLERLTRIYRGVLDRYFA